MAVADVLPLLKNKHNNNHLEFMTIEQGKSPFLFPAPLLRFMSSNCTFIRLLSIYPLILLRCSNIVNSSNSSAIFLQVRVKIIFSIVPQFILFHFLSTRMTKIIIQHFLILFNLFQISGGIRLKAPSIHVALASFCGLRLKRLLSRIAAARPIL